MYTSIQTPKPNKQKINFQILVTHESNKSTLVNVYIDLLVFTHIAEVVDIGVNTNIEKHAICHKDYRLQSCLRIQYVHGDLCKHLGIDSSAKQQSTDKIKNDFSFFLLSGKLQLEGS